MFRETFHHIANRIGRKLPVAARIGMAGLSAFAGTVVAPMALSAQECAPEQVSGFTRIEYHQVDGVCRGFINYGESWKASPWLGENNAGWVARGNEVLHDGKVVETFPGETVVVAKHNARNELIVVTETPEGQHYEIINLNNGGKVTESRYPARR